MSPQYSDALAWTVDGILVLLVALVLMILGGAVGFLTGGARGAGWGIIAGFGVACAVAAVSAAAGKKSPIPL